MSNPIYFQTIRNLFVGFGDLFNNLTVQTLDQSNNVVKLVRIPIAATRKQKYIARLRQEIQKQGNKKSPNIEITLPRLSYDMVSIAPDPSRKMNTFVNQIRENDKDGVIRYLKQLAGVPYTAQFELNAYTYHLDEMLQIVEQITPMFTPDFNINITDVPELHLTRDIPILLDGISPDDSYDGLLTDYRFIQWTFSFTANFYLYPPIRDAKIIRRVIANIKESEQKTSAIVINEVDPFDANKSDNWSVKETIIDDPE